MQVATISFRLVRSPALLGELDERIDPGGDRPERERVTSPGT